MSVVSRTKPLYALEEKDELGTKGLPWQGVDASSYDSGCLLVGEIG